MRAHVIFSTPNPSFNIEYARQYNHGRESDGNRKNIESYTKSIDGNVTAVNIHKNVNFFQGNFEFKDVTVIELTLDTNAVCSFVVSKSLIRRTLKNKNAKYDIMRVYVYLKANKEYTRIGNLTIATNELPKGFPSSSENK